jgi:hypothetical protein
MVWSSIVPPLAADGAALPEADAGALDATGFAAAELAGAEALGLAATDAAMGLVDAEIEIDGAGAALEGATGPAWPHAARARGSRAGSTRCFNMTITIKQIAFRAAS